MLGHSGSTQFLPETANPARPASATRQQAAVIGTADQFLEVLIKRIGHEHGSKNNEKRGVRREIYRSRKKEDELGCDTDTQ